MGSTGLEIEDGPLVVGTFNGSSLQISSQERNERGALQTIDGTLEEGPPCHCLPYGMESVYWHTALLIDVNERG